ncbi:hypothetical protein ACRE_044450 [Hapsidospora chrysogenum ATCC 11550]|uniref:Uncharacterized protein n=1 Tax=Hapsidospora chrysogenum (strain ATCC 11550 / CBS 779.69 / DSM 880 / IAM 14645 / JCM 23072 / IMI 49137) TaxID=857340 RepID=A0A086T5V2_HAPC1|nr:hypothetical protein ACRE_044450 [Hapsidospora chrysogenum ATCC 11550]
MSPPPSTPTPRRFLLPKRAPPQSGGFLSTPRFAPPPPPSSLSVPLRSTQSRRQTLEALDDDEDEDKVDGSSVEGDDNQEGRGRAMDVLGDSIEVTSDESLSPSAGNSEDGMTAGELAEGSSPEDASTPPREIKRRKLSLSSPPPAFSSPSKNRSFEIGVEEDYNGGDITEEHPQSPLEIAQDDYHPSDAEGRRERAPQQPTFRPAPRFKLSEAESLGEGLPAAFSPQRRRAKYLTGGLAAQLQGWLSEAKREDERPGSSFRVTVLGVKAGRRMYMVSGTVNYGAEPRKVILAGEGRLTGLGGRGVVMEGSVVEIGQPVWDVQVDGEAWMVACDWTIL